MEQIKDISTGYRWVVWFAFKWLAATTAVTVWQVSAGFIPTASETLQLLFRIAACVVMFFFIDAGLETQAKYVFRGLMDKQTREGGKWFLTLSVFIFVIRFAASTVMTYVSADPIASSIYPPPSTDREQTEIAAARESSDAKIAKLEKEKSKLEASEAQRIRDAERKGKALVNDAISAGGESFARLWQEGNNWVKTAPQLKKKREKVYEAQKQAAALIAEEKAKTASAQSAYLAALGKEDPTIAALASDIKRKGEEHDNNKASMTLTIYLVDFIAAFVAIALLIALCSYEKKNNIQYKSDFSGVWEKVGDRIKGDLMQNAETGSLGLWLFVSSILEALSKFFHFAGALLKKAVHKVETTFRLDLDGDGKIGDPEKSVKSPTQTTDAPEQKVGRNPIGFSVNKTDVKVGEKSAGNTDALHAKNTDVGVTPTSPTSAPTFTWENLQKVGEKSVENPPTSAPTREGKSTDFSGVKPPTLRQPKTEKIGKGRAAGDTDLDRMADAARSAWTRYKQASMQCEEIERAYNEGKVTLEQLNAAKESALNKKTTWENWRKELIKHNFTVYASPGGRHQAIIKPKAAARKSKPKKRS